MNKAKISVVGSLNMDLVYRVAHLPAPGETLLARSYMQAPGGKGANQAVAAARQGASVAMIGCIGADDLGNSLRSNLANDGINIDHVSVVPEHPTGMASIYVNDDAENNIVILAGANSQLTVNEIAAAKKTIADSQCLLCQFETPLATFEAAAGIAKAHGVKVILNPSPMQPFDLQLLRLVDVLIVNEIEAKQLANVNDLEQALSSLCALGVSNLILTQGEHGVTLAISNTTTHYPAFKANAIDTTAAGDTFTGAFAAEFAQGFNIATAITRAQAASAICVTKLGAQPSIPHRAEVDELLEKQYKRDHH